MTQFLLTCISISQFVIMTSLFYYYTYPHISHSKCFNNSFDLMYLQGRIRELEDALDSERELRLRVSIAKDRMNPLPLVKI